MLKFFFFSISAGLIQTVVFTLLNESFRLPYWPCYLAALTLSVLYNFTVNRRFTFQSAANVPVAMAKVALFYLVFTPLSLWWGEALARLGWNFYIILFGTMAINLVLEFLYCRFFVFRDSMETNDIAKKSQNRPDSQE